jgi:hypothetical protein
VCPECGFQNKPGLRYCANCGMSLAPAFAPTSPPPAEPDPQAPDIPDPDAAIALRQQEAQEDAETAMPFASEPARRHAPLVLAVVVVLLAIAGIAAWMYMRDSDPVPPMIGVTAAPVAPTIPASAASAAPAAAEAAPAAASTAPTATASETANVPASEPASAPEAAPAAASAQPTEAAPLGAPPAAAPALPQITDTARPPDERARSLAAERRRERVAREKAEREAKAKAKAIAEQREQSNAAAAQRAEQEAQARRRAEDAQRARSAAIPAPPAPAATQARGVREICAGRGTIAEAVCQSRQCGAREHANEPICRQLREQDERRRNYTN